MKRSLLILCLLVMASTLFAVMAGCATQPPIERAVMCSKVSPSGEPATPSDTFAPDVSAIYCSVKLAKVSAESTVKAQWYVVNSDEASLKNSLIGQGTVAAGSPYVVLQFTRADQLLPRGDYKVDLYYDSALAKTVTFKVQGEAALSLATLSEATMCTSVNLLTDQAIDKVDTFPNDISKIFCSARVDKADFGTVVKARWTYVEGALDALKGKVIYEPTTRVEGRQYVSFSIGMPAGKLFPIGKYNITLSIGGQEMANLPFAVIDAAAIKWPYVSEMSTFVYTDKDQKALSLTAQFPADAKQVNFRARTYNAPMGTQLDIQWILDRSTDGIYQQKLIKEDNNQIDGTTEIRAALAVKSDPFIPGDYLVKVLINGQEVASVPFKVQ